MENIDLEEFLKQERQLLFNVRRSVRYHNRRRRFFDRLNTTITFITALSGSATLVSVLAKLDPVITTVFAVIVAVSSVIDLVIGTARATQEYNDLAKRFIELEKEIISSKEQTFEAIEGFTIKRLDIEKDEPPILRVLDSICYNEMLKSMGYPESNFVKIGRVQKLLSNLIDFNEDKIIKFQA